MLSTLYCLLAETRPPSNDSLSPNPYPPGILPLTPGIKPVEPLIGPSLRECNPNEPTPYPDLGIRVNTPADPLGRDPAGGYPPNPQKTPKSSKNADLAYPPKRSNFDFFLTKKSITLFFRKSGGSYGWAKRNTFLGWPRGKIGSRFFGNGLPC